MTMKRFQRWHIVACLFLLAECAQAEEMKLKGTSVEDIVPAGWTHHEAHGDMNSDGIMDLAVVAIPDDEENTLTRDDGYVYNFNQPILAIYFGTEQGLVQWKRFDNVIPADESEFCHHDIGLEITPRGTLRIAIGVFCSAGSYGTTTDTYTYRHQDGDFYLIGKDHEEMMRNTGECITVSENYLTRKRQVVKSNIDDTEPTTEKWSRLPRKSLEKLGARELSLE